MRGPFPELELEFAPHGRWSRRRCSERSLEVAVDIGGAITLWPHGHYNGATMELGIRALKGGELSRAIKRATRGEVVVVTDRGRPVARIVPYEPTGVPAQIAELVRGGGIEYRAPFLDGIELVAMTPGEKTAADYVVEQRR
jgi:prevent-host-death family protein